MAQAYCTIMECDKGRDLNFAKRAGRRACQFWERKRMQETRPSVLGRDDGL